MASSEEARAPLDIHGIPSDSPLESPGSTNLKRKTTFDHEDDDNDSSNKKRKSDSTRDDTRRPSLPPPIRRSHGPSRQETQQNGSSGRLSTSIEERKRSKRLFGGLLSTLNQTNANSQQKRRVEIERRQQERMQQQRLEDDQKRSERLAHTRSVRMAQQRGFEEKVMSNRHDKLLWTAKFLKTRAEPSIFYMPNKLNKEQEDTIDSQIREAKQVIERDLEAFKRRPIAHNDRHEYEAETSLRRLSPVRSPVRPWIDEAAPREYALKEKANGHATEAANEEEPQHELKKERVKQEQKPVAVSHHDHDDPSDIVDHVGEDMVIY